jgi:hypothetical protein
MQGEQPQGRLSTDELARLEAAGIINTAGPSTAQAAVFDQVMLDEFAPLMLSWSRSRNRALDVTPGDLVEDVR